ncbi:MAG: BatA domain-containing protein, partial [Flavobacteriales bacterium]
MKFLHPEILWGLSALSIPILVHLFNFRRFKKVQFSNVAFLKDIRQETQSKRILRHLLILAARMLAIACLVLAFAQPFIPAPSSKEREGGSAVSIYIDNSFSMESQGQDGRLLDLAKNKAIEIVEAHKASDRFQLVTADFDGAQQHLLNQDEMIERIQEVELSPAARKLSEVMLRQHDVILRSSMPNRKVFIISDLQRTVSDFANLPVDTSLRYYLIPELAQSTGNCFIDSVWFESPVRLLNQPEILHARVVNTDEDERKDLPVQWEVDGLQKSVASVTIPPKSQAVVDITFTNTEPGDKLGLLKVVDGKIAKDDDFYAAFHVASQIPVLVIHGNAVSAKPVDAVFSNDPYFKLTTVGEGNVDYGAFSSNRLIVVNQVSSMPTGLAMELGKFASNGGSVFVIPAPNASVTEYNAALSALQLGTFSNKVSASLKASEANYENPLYRDAFEQVNGNVEMPSVKAYFPLSGNAEPLLRLQNGAPLIVVKKIGAGNAYATTVSLQDTESDLAKHAFFPATLIRAAEFSQHVAPLSYTLGQPMAIELPNHVTSSDAAYKLIHSSTRSELIPEHRNVGGKVELFVPKDLNEAG